MFVYFFFSYNVPRQHLLVSHSEHVYMRAEVNSNRFEISNRFEKLLCLHGDITAATFQAMIRFYCTRANDDF